MQHLIITNHWLRLWLSSRCESPVSGGRITLTSTTATAAATTTLVAVVRRINQHQINSVGLGVEVWWGRVVDVV